MGGATVQPYIDRLISFNLLKIMARCTADLTEMCLTSISLLIFPRRNLSFVFSIHILYSETYYKTAKESRHKNQSFILIPYPFTFCVLCFYEAQQLQFCPIMEFALSVKKLIHFPVSLMVYEKADPKSK